MTTSRRPYCCHDAVGSVPQVQVRRYICHARSHTGHHVYVRTRRNLTFAKKKKTCGVYLHRSVCLPACLEPLVTAGTFSRKLLRRTETGGRIVYTNTDGIDLFAVRPPRLVQCTRMSPTVRCTTLSLSSQNAPRQ